MRRFGQILLIIVLIVLTSGAVFCEDFSRPVVIATTVVSATETEETALGKVILDSAVLQLRLEGFEVRVVDSSALPPPKDEQDFLIISEYRVTGDSISINIRAMESGSYTEEPTADGSWSGPLSLTLDKEIQKIVRTDITPSLPRSIEVSRRETEKAAAAGTAWAVAAISKDGLNDEIDTDTDNLKNRWRLNIGGILTVPLSNTATWALLGYGGQVSFGYAFPAGSISIVPQIVTGGTFMPTDAPIPTDIIIIPLGLDLKIASASNQPMLPYLRFGGGVTWFMVIPEGSSIQGKIVPYADAGLGIDFRFGQTIGLYADVSFRALF